MAKLPQNDANRALGERIQAARMRAGMTATALATAVAAEMGINFQSTQIDRIEQGLRPLRAVEVGPFATVLGMTVRDVLGDGAPEQRGVPRSVLVLARDLQVRLDLFLEGNAL